MNLANKITMGRIILAFVFLIAVFSNSILGKILALLIFIIAAITDYLDGYIAKKYNIISDFGKINAINVYTSIFLGHADGNIGGTGTHI